MSYSTAVAAGTIAQK